MAFYELKVGRDFYKNNDKNSPLAYFYQQLINITNKHLSTLKYIYNNKIP